MQFDFEVLLNAIYYNVSLRLLVAITDNIIITNLPTHRRFRGLKSAISGTVRKSGQSYPSSVQPFSSQTFFKHSMLCGPSNVLQPRGKTKILRRFQHCTVRALCRRQVDKKQIYPGWAKCLIQEPHATI